MNKNENILNSSNLKINSFINEVSKLKEQNNLLTNDGIKFKIQNEKSQMELREINNKMDLFLKK